MADVGLDATAAHTRVAGLLDGVASLVGVGVDLVDILRFGRVLDRTPAVATRVFTVGERAYAARHRNQVPHLAVRFAAKESVMKAMGCGLWTVGLDEIEVVRDDESGAPAVLLHGAAADRGTALGIESWRLALTHTDTIAESVAIALGPGDGQLGTSSSAAGPA